MRVARASLVVSFAAVVGCGDEAAAPIGIDESFLDRTADPCTDFYQFACGTWVSQHPADPGTVRSRYYDGDSRAQIYYRKLLEDPPADSDPDLAKAQKFFVACESAYAASFADLLPVGEQVAAIRAMATPADLAPTLARLHRDGVSALFRAVPDVDPGQPTRRVLTLFDDGWSLPSKQEYGPDLEGAYEAHMTAVSGQLLGATGISIDAKLVYDFEAALAAATPDAAFFRDPVAIYNLTATSVLAEMVPVFDWATYLAAAGLASAADVNVVEPAFFTGLQALLAATPLDTLKQYLTWRVYEAEAGMAGGGLIAAEYAFHERTLFGRTDQPPAWWSCLQNTRAVFGPVLAHHFVERFVPVDPRPAATQMYDRIRAAMQADISGLAWLDDPTRAAALGKLADLLPKIGYADRWPTYDDISVVNLTYLGMWLGMNRTWGMEAPQRLTQPVDRTVFTTSPDVTNAFYSPKRNDASFPLAILGDPFFSADWPEPLGYGALGAIMGHETTHGFDDDGRAYDGIGKLSDWWSDAVDAEFQRRAQCLVDQYDAYEPIPGTHVDGALTLGENIADLGGVKLAYAAFHEAGLTRALTASFTPEQQFFLSYAHVRCGDESPGYLAQLLATDPHSPRKLRVNGVVRNIPAFADAFHCPVGSPMAPPPEQRCELW